VFDWATLRPIWEPRALSILRIMVGLLYLEHGLAKIFGFPALPNHAPYHLFSLVPGVAGILEAVGGALIALGLFTRPVAFILAGEMAFAYFMSHAPRSFFPLVNAGDAAILYCFIFLYFFVVGAGVWSLDQLWTSRTAGGRG
jgi:putative oxidoreductase